MSIQPFRTSPLPPIRLAKGHAFGAPRRVPDSSPGRAGLLILVLVLLLAEATLCGAIAAAWTSLGGMR